ncbi:unnamed protein product [Prorocentrum cordatum]|uniref:Uncharacterized protein n=1 Tax=Prorocentrum cordatum TaxID=2364126 RepID=A0ABN9VAB0_9DINO|nr:unnamed protein product [Polarella glacialis]
MSAGTVRWSSAGISSSSSFLRLSRSPLASSLLPLLLLLLLLLLLSLWAERNNLVRTAMACDGSCAGRWPHAHTHDAAAGGELVLLAPPAVVSWYCFGSMAYWLMNVCWDCLCSTYSR